MTPPIKCYNKNSLRYLLKNPNVNMLTKKDKETGEVVVPYDYKTLEEKISPYLKELRIVCYKKVSIFTPSQVRLIFELML